MDLERTPASQPEYKAALSPLLFILIAIVVMLSALSGFLAYQNVQLQKQITLNGQAHLPRPTPTPVVATNPETGWQKYTNTRYGYSLEYPSDWKVTVGTGDDSEPETVSQIRLSPASFAKNETLMWVRASQTYYKDTIDLSKNLGNCRPNSECITIYSKNNSTLDGTSALRYTHSQLGPGQVLTVDALKNGHIYSLDLERPEDSQENVKIFDQILSTFKFLDQPSTVSLYPTPPASWQPHAFPSWGLTIYAPSDWQSNIEDFPSSSLIKFWKKSSPSIVPIQLDIKSDWSNTGDAQTLSQNFWVGNGIEAFRADPPKPSEKTLERYQTNVYFELNKKVYVFQCVHNWTNDYLETCEMMLKTLQFAQ